MRSLAMVGTHPSDGVQATIDLGIRFAETLISGDVVLLCGTLGSGKTEFARGIAAALGVSSVETLHSPTYDLIHTHQCGSQKDSTDARDSGSAQIHHLHHMDLFRLDKLSVEDVAWLSEYWWEPNAVSVIEWGDLVRETLDGSYWRIAISTPRDGTDHGGVPVSTTAPSGNEARVVEIRYCVN